MINSKSDYIEYLKADKEALNKKYKRPKYKDYIWKYEILLRKCEYYHNCKKGLINKFIYKVYSFRRFRLGVKCGFEIPINVFGKGLSIAHKGPIVVNSGTKVGDNCRIHVCVNIGTQAGYSNLAPEIGNNVYIAPGAKIFGKIQIADDIVIGANAVVNKSFVESGVSIGGVPAKKISEKGRLNLKEN